MPWRAHRILSLSKSRSSRHADLMSMATVCRCDDSPPVIAAGWIGQVGVSLHHSQGKGSVQKPVIAEGEDRWDETVPGVIGVSCLGGHHARRTPGTIQPRPARCS